MELNWLEDFLCVVSEAHFARAAAVRNITPSAITRHVKALERWAGEELLDRSQMPIRPSAAGRLFIPMAERMLEDAYGAKQTIREFRSQHKKDIVFSAYNSLALYDLSALIVDAKAVLGDFRTRVVTNIETTGEYLSSVEDGVFDFFLCYRHPQIRMQFDAATFSHIDLRSEIVSPFAAQSQGHHDLHSKHGPPIPFLRHTGSAFMSKIVDIVLQNAPSRHRFKAVYETTLTQTLCNAAQAGLGITWLPESIASRAWVNQPLIKMDNDLVTEVVVTLIWARKNTRSIVRSFAEHAIETLTAQNERISRDDE